MTRRKGDSYLGGHTIWPKYYERPDANDLELQRERSRQRILENVLKETTIRKRIPGKPRKITSRHAISRQQVQLSEIGFGGRFGETVLDALDRVLCVKQRWNNEEIASHWNSIRFYTASGKEWSPMLVAFARKQLIGKEEQLVEIGFRRRFGETVLDALDRVLRERPRWNNEEIANHWNSIGFYTASGNKWTLALVAIARRKLSRSQNPKNRRDTATGRLLRRTLFE